MSPAELDPRPRAQELADALRPEVELFVQQLADLLARTESAALFGDAQLTLRDLALRFAARACEARLRGKKTATPAPG
jgi:hypothetical protein